MGISGICPTPKGAFKSSNVVESSTGVRKMPNTGELRSFVVGVLALLGRP